MSLSCAAAWPPALVIAVVMDSPASQHQSTAENPQLPRGLLMSVPRSMKPTPALSGRPSRPARMLAAAQEGPMRRTCRVYQNRPRKDRSYTPARVPRHVQTSMAEEGRNNVLAHRLMLAVGQRRSEAVSVTWA
jgi:hypothetical protein